MYYRYKSKKRSNQKIKVLGIVFAAAVVLYPVYHFRDHLQFWKYSYNKIVSQVYSAETISDKAAKKAAFLKAITMCNDYEENHPFSSEAYYLESRADFLMGETDSGADFTSFVVDNKKNSSDR